MKEFKDIQRVTMWWVYLICFFVLGIAVWGFIYQVVLGNKFGNNPGPDIFLYLTLVLALILVWLVFSARLILTVNSSGVSFRYVPLISKKFTWNEITECEVLEYNPVKDYGGWGLRYNFKMKRKVYSVSGNKGLSLTLKSGQKVIIGTARADDLSAFLNENQYLN